MRVRELPDGQRDATESSSIAGPPVGFGGKEECLPFLDSQLPLIRVAVLEVGRAALTSMTGKFCCA